VTLGGRVVERLRGALRLGVQKTLGLVSAHYLIDFDVLQTCYVLTDGLDNHAEIDAIN
jgi:hypothetical protein